MYGLNEWIRVMYCKRALMSVVQRDRWSPSILRQYNRPWMLVNSCTEQQIWSGHIQTPTTSRTLQCNQETLELALDSHWKLFITPLHVFFLNSSLLWPGDNYSRSLRLKYRVVMFDRMFSLSTASAVLLIDTFFRSVFCSDFGLLVCGNRTCSWMNICWYLSSIAINQSNFSVRVSM